MQVLLLIFAVWSSVFASEVKRKGMAGPCKSDSECVLYADECRFLNSILKSEIPAEAIAHKYEDHTTVYFWGSAERICSIMYIKPPDWPKRPVPKCVRKKCVVGSTKN